MDNNQNEEEIYILVDEDGNEIVEENEPEIFESDSFEQEYFEQEYFEQESFEQEVEMPEEFELEESVIDDEDDNGEYDDSDEGFFGNISTKILAIIGGVIAVAAICLGIFFINTRNVGGKVDFSNVGKTVADIGVIGAENIRAIAAARGSYIDDINEAIKSYDYMEADLEGGITTVDLTLTSIIKDLKIKFVNASGKLIASVPFEVEVTGPDGKTTTWTDTDKDGIIYQSDIAGGAYTVKLVAMNGYDALYDFSNSKSAKSVTVKTQLDYQKVDVKNEIKIQNSSNQAEDAALKETVVESKLKDTVDYVMSNRSATSGYNVIDKSTVANPIEALTKSYEAAIGRFKRLSGPVNVTEGDTSSDSDDGQGSGDDSGQGSGEGGGEKHEHVYPQTGWTKVDDTSCTATCTVDGCTHTTKEDHAWGEDGKCTRCGADKPAEHSHNYGTPNWSGTSGDWKHTKTCANTDNKCTQVTVEEPCTKEYTQNSDGTHNVKCNVCHHEETNIPCTAGADGKCVCGRDMTVKVTGKASITPANTTPLNLSSNKSLKLTAGCEIKEGKDAVKAYKYKWKIKSGDSVTLPSADENSDITVTASKTGTTTVELTITLKDGDGKDLASLTQTYDVVVGAVTVTLDRTAKKAIYVGGDTFAVKATTKGGQTNKVKWTCSDENVATITTSETANGTEGINTVTVKGVKAGKVKLTATSEDDKSQTASIEIVVATHPKDDKSTKLTDKSGKQVYVYDSTSKTYREAVYADYYSGVDLYTPVDVVYTYTGWWTIDGKTYYYDKNGKKVTGEQVILGAKYSFDSNGVLKSGTGTFGIDVSTFNGTIDWSKVAKSGVSFAIIRCGLRGSTAGALYEDAKFATNIKNATAAGVKVGLYFFTQATTEAEAVEEASMALTLAEGYKISYPIFIDVENATNGRANSLSKDQRTKVILAFCKTISNGGYKAGIYANKTWFTGYMDVSQLTGYTIWLAQYASSPTYTASRYDLWQYSSEGSLNGISGAVDLDLSYLGY